MGESRHDGDVLKNDEGVQINLSVTKMVLDVSGKQLDDVYILIELARPLNIGPALHINPRAAEAYYGMVANTRFIMGKRHSLLGQETSCL